MTSCPACRNSVPDGGRFCPACGSAVGTPTSLPTVADSGAASFARSYASDARRVATPDPGAQARFVPGALIAGRYRVVGLLGRGGMGEVYRADDLKLGQPVALKLLPDALARNPAALARFHNEVRVARQISHPNVCRVYDIAEAEGLHFISMEYVDGEDLASLLRRIGRLPEDRALVIARQICAGVAAAHDLGMIHRDLKPENVMIDGRGRVRLTDFGLTGFAEEITGRELASGTPAYMAPEQLERREVSVRSDVYALGLVLYEMFTGHQVFDGPTLADITRQHAAAVPKRPSLHVDTLDPAVERVILRCLEKEPANRPDSALAVSAALPGGDPLAEALAAGETPSPEMVAAAGGAAGIGPTAAGLLLAAAISLTALVAVVSDRVGLLHQVPLDRPPEAMVERARDALARLGVQGRPADSAHGLDLDRSVLDWLRAHDLGAARWAPLATGRTGAVTFWYRESPATLYPQGLLAEVTSADPNPFLLSGMATVCLDESGRLSYFHRVPPQVPAEVAAAETNWSAALELAGVDPARFRPTTPKWLPPTFADRAAAWEGTFADLPGIPVRVEAAAFRGQPVYFEVVWPWMRPARMPGQVDPTSRRVGITINIVLVFIGLVGATILARRNLRSGRGDRKGAWRLGAWSFALMLAIWLLEAHHQTRPELQWSLFIRGVSFALFIGGFVWVVYIGLEPVVRRVWPHTLISWSRLLAGRARDPMVGRDVLIGVVLAGLSGFLAVLMRELAGRMGSAPLPDAPSLDGVEGIGAFLAWLFANQINALLPAMMFLLLLVGLRGLLRSTAGAVIGSIALLGTILTAILLQDWPPPIAVLAGVIGATLTMTVLVRYGLLAMAVGQLIGRAVGTLPATIRVSDWYFAYYAAALAATVGLCLWAFSVARAPAKTERTSGG